MLPKYLFNRMFSSLQVRYKIVLFSNVGILLVYFQLLSRDLMHALIKKRPDVSPEDIILHQDNAPPHTASTTQLEIDVLGFQRLAHPPYSPDLAPMDFRVFPEVKSQLRGIHFNSANELMLKTQRIVSSFDSQWYRDTYDKWEPVIGSAQEQEGTILKKFKGQFDATSMLTSSDNSACAGWQ